MTVSAGARLGSYEVVSAIGAGGMGEVWRAKDTRVGRDVAIKVLPSDHFADPERRARFEREARALASLNHPGIAVLYSFEEIAGSQPFHILVMELLEGATLRGALADGKLPAKKALSFARQIAEALAAAHDKGIVHRDLKPENVFVTRDGRTKILDFGLAKIAHPGAGGGSESATLALETEAGVVLGTLGYMSPEQVRGEPADLRSDIFSFGAILHEMLTGRRAFQRATAAETISAILREDPPEPSGTDLDLAPGLRRLVAHCLEKEPERRFRSAHDLAFDLETLSVVSGIAPTSAASPPARRVRVAGVALAAAALALAALAGVLFARSRATAPLPSFKRLTFRNGTIWNARFTPDAQTVVYGAAWDANPTEVFLTRLESPESRSLGLGAASLLAVSATSELGVMLQAHTTSRGYERLGTLARVPLAGGSPRPLLENVRHADFAPDGRDLMVARVVDGKHRIELPAGKVLYETPLPIVAARLSPDGDAVAFWEEEVRASRMQLRVVDRAGKTRTLASTSDFWGVAWSPDGREVLYSAPEPGISHTVSTLQAVSLSGKNRLLMRFPGTLELLDVARDGRVLVSRVTFETHVAAISDGAKVPRELAWLDGAQFPNLSADGGALVVTEMDEGGGPSHGIYLRKTDGSPATLIGEGDALALSRDGAWVLAREVGAKGTLTLLPTGVGAPRKLAPEGLEGSLRGCFFPGADRLVVEETIPDRPSRTYVVPVGGGKPTPLAPPGFSLPDFGTPVSPDGRLVALLDRDRRAHLCPTGGGRPVPIAGVESEEFPIQWTPDGRSVFTHRGGGLPARVWKVELATGRRELVHEFTPSDAAGVASIEGVVVTPDGRTLVALYWKTLTSLYVVSGLRIRA